MLQAGQEIEITKRKRVIARLTPARPERAPSRPDFLARLKAIYGSKRLRVTGSHLLSQERERF
jgi:antitoxin (DNA-binding transcriptional repressor) of toxin-antitoxin stability system